MSEPKSKAWIQNLAMIHVIVVLWFSKVYVYCTLHPQNTIIPHEGYNPYTILETIVQMTYTMMPQPECFPHHKHRTLLCSWGVFSYTLGYVYEISRFCTIAVDNNIYYVAQITGSWQ